MKYNHFENRNLNKYKLQHAMGLVKSQVFTLCYILTGRCFGKISNHIPAETLLLVAIIFLGQVECWSESSGNGV